MAADSYSKIACSDSGTLLITLAHTSSHRPQEEKQWNEIPFPDIAQLKATPPHPIQLQAPDLTGEGKHQDSKGAAHSGVVCSRSVAV